tara:strand:- start:281 stop:586 length:306 start_codon:yes stop_codon:yes gene_type:complete
MTTLSQYDREEAAYLLWEATGGPERKAAKDLAGMNAVLADAEAKGWEVLKRWTDSDGWGGRCEHVVLMKDNREIVRAHYNSVGKNIMQFLDSGASVTWRPE